LRKPPRTREQEGVELAQSSSREGDEEGARELAQLASRRSRRRIRASWMRCLASSKSVRLSSVRPMGLYRQTCSGRCRSRSPAQTRKLSEQAAQGAAEAAKGWSKELSAEELKKLAAELKELSKLLEGSDLQELSKLLSEASECLKSGNCDKGQRGTGRRRGSWRSWASPRQTLAVAARPHSTVPRRDQVRYGQGGPAPQESIPPNAPATQLFAPRQSDNPGDLERVRAQINPEGPMMSTTEKGAPAGGQRLAGAYYEVISDYSKTQRRRYPRRRCRLLTAAR